MSMPVCNECQKGAHCHGKNYVVYTVGPMMGGSQCKCGTCTEQGDNQ